MHFICTQANLLRGVTDVSPLAGRNPQLPILQQVLLEVRDGALHLTCTDLEVGARSIVGGKSEADGSCVVPARQLVEYVQQLPNRSPIVITQKKKHLNISTEGFSSHFPVTAPDDFPILPVTTNKDPINLPGRVLAQAISQAVFAAARDGARPEINGLLIKGEGANLRVVATDSFRLAERVVALEGEASFSLLLPLSAAQEVGRLFGRVDMVDLYINESHVTWQADGMILTSRLVDGTYPDYQQIIPTKYVAQGVVARDELLRALKILNVFLTRESRRVVIRVVPADSNVEFRVEGGDSGQGEVVVPFEGTGETIEVVFNSSYLLDGAAHIPGDKCELRFGGVSDPLMFMPHNKNGESLYLVMPIQV